MIERLIDLLASHSVHAKGVTSIDVDGQFLGAIVTRTALIRGVLERCYAPVINVEAYVFDSDDETGFSKRLDVSAFVKSVISALAAPIRARRGSLSR